MDEALLLRLPGAYRGRRRALETFTAPAGRCRPAGLARERERLPRDEGQPERLFVLRLVAGEPAQDLVPQAALDGYIAAAELPPLPARFA